MFNLKDVKYYFKPFGSVETNIGLVYLYPLRLKAGYMLYEKLSGDHFKINTEDFMKYFIGLTCSLTNKEITIKEEPIDIIAENLVSKLSELDFENIAKTFLEKDILKGDKKRNTVSESVKLAENGESYCDSLKAIIFQRAKEHEASIQRSFGFSNKLNKQIMDTLSFGDSIKKLIEPLSLQASAAQSIIASIKPTSSCIDDDTQFPPTKLLKEISQPSWIQKDERDEERHVELISWMKKNLSFSIETHKTNTKSATEQIHLTKQTLTVSRLTLFASIISIILPILLLIFNIGSQVKSQDISQLSGNISQMSDVILNTRNAQMDEMKKKYEALLLIFREENEKLRVQLKEQSLEIDKLKALFGKK